jgi:hypothetical protein
MKKLLAIVIMLSLPAMALSADLTLSWDAMENASGYTVERSIDSGATWEKVADVTANSVALSAQPDSGLALYRVGAYNGQGEVTRTYSGAWYNGDWLLPGMTSGVGVE